MLDQLEPLLLETAGGAAEFIPAPDETKRLIRTYYAVKRNLLVRYGLTDIAEPRQWSVPRHPTRFKPSFC